MPKAGQKRKKKEGRKMSGVSRYAAALHFLTVIPRTALLPLSHSPTGGRRLQARTGTYCKIINYRL